MKSNSKLHSAQSEGENAPSRRARRKNASERERGMDKTLADSYPASDPPSSIPDPKLDEAAETKPSKADEAA